MSIEQMVRTYDHDGRWPVLGSFERDREKLAKDGWRVVSTIAEDRPVKFVSRVILAPFLNPALRKSRTVLTVTYERERP